jgi:hypothetical protein
VPRWLAVLAFLGFARIACPQAPTGIIIGTVIDESGAVIPKARISITQKETGLNRTMISAADGTYSAAALPAGPYQIEVEAPGMALLARDATVETGMTTKVDLAMRVGAAAQKVSVDAATPQIHYDSHKIDGVVTRVQIENLPLNGRSFVQLAMLEPGVTATAVGGQANNRQFDIAVLGADQSRTRISVDGASTGQFSLGGSQLGVSQEAVQEFQISTVNLDLSTGLTGAGAVNIVTRSGGNNFHGSGFFFFRDHNLSAYPALERDPLNPDPFFARRQSGFYLGGPVHRDRLFFFANLEHNNQDAVQTIQLRTPEFAKFGGIFSNPYTGTQLNGKLDLRVNANSNGFLRFTHDGNDAFTPGAGARERFSLPSSWRGNNNWSDQSIVALTTVLRPTLVNDLRFSYTHLRSRIRMPTAADCGSGCLGLGYPNIDVSGADFVTGNNALGSVSIDNRNYDWIESLTWQSGRHRFRSGLEWEHYNSQGAFGFGEPAAMVLFSPETARRANLPLPTSFDTIEDILRLPLSTFTAGIGDPTIPAFLNRDRARRSDKVRLYWHDTWRIRPRFSLNYGLTSLIQSQDFNTDLPKPTYLVPIFGSQGLQPARHRTPQWAPALGFAWSVAQDGKTVIRAGAGIYQDALLRESFLQTERSSLGPRGVGRFRFSGSQVLNPIPDIPGVPLGRPINFPGSPTAFTGLHLLSILPAIRATLQQQFGDPLNTDLSVRNIELFKTGSQLLPPDYTTPYAEHFNVGAQRQITSSLVISSDFVFRQFLHTSVGEVDFNHFNSVRGPALPRCSGSPPYDPKALCSAGAITVRPSAGRSHYKGLLVRVDKRFSRRTQFLVSYALSSNIGLTSVRNLDNWFDSFGPLASDRRHLLNVSGVINLPRGLVASFISSISSRPPFTASLANLDFNGDGINGDVLPGSRENQFNRGLGKSDLARLVAEFNQKLAGTTTPRNQPIPRITLPARYEFGDNFFSQDLRLSKNFRLHERAKLTILGEVFNLFNIANLLGYGDNLLQPSNFGQPTTRVSQVFGSGGPRAFQLGMRVSF